MAREYDVFMFTLPEVTEDGTSIPGPPSQVKRFDSLEAAREFAERNKDKFSRITINAAAAEAPALIERYEDGQRTIVRDASDSDSSAASSG